MINSQLPRCLGNAAAVIDDPREDEEEIRQAVDVTHQHRVDRRIEPDHPAFRAAADRARDVKRGARRGAAGQDEAAQRGELLVEPIDQLFEPDHMAVADHGFGDAGGELVGGIGELGAERE